VKAIRLEQPGQLRRVDLDDPGALQEGFALVRTRRVGICGTDWHAYHGRQPFFTYPRVLGHELGVEVEAVNDATSDLKPGDRCSVEPYINCGTCVACRTGKGNCCVNLRVLGVHTDGGMCERLVVPARKLHRSARLSLDQLALVETLAIGCHAVARAAPKRGERVLILGAGPIGLSVIPFVRAAGGIPIVGDVSESRLAFARDPMNVADTIDARGDVARHLGELPTTIIDATGNPQSMARCFDLVAHGGRIVFVGLFQGDVTFDDPNFHRREITLMASRNALPQDFTNIIGLIEAGKIDTTPWITHRCGAAELIDVLPTWLSGNVLKAVVEF
jgi:2-desacetyl-2-hydroxyethyl bacteriochlorophyllide A dehydrogenase